MVAARFHHVGARDDGLPDPSRQPSPRRRRTERTAIVPQSSPVWHRLGRNWRGHGLLRDRARLREAAKAIRQQTDRFAPACPGEARLDDYGNHKGAIPRAAGRALEGPGTRASLADFHAEDEQRLDGARISAPRAGDPWRKWY